MIYCAAIGKRSSLRCTNQRVGTINMTDHTTGETYDVPVCGTHAKVVERGAGIWIEVRVVSPSSSMKRRKR